MTSRRIYSRHHTLNLFMWACLFISVDLTIESISVASFGHDAIRSALTWTARYLWCCRNRDYFLRRELEADIKIFRYKLRRLFRHFSTSFLVQIPRFSHELQPQFQYIWTSFWSPGRVFIRLIYDSIISTTDCILSSRSHNVLDNMFKKSLPSVGCNSCFQL